MAEEQQGTERQGTVVLEVNMSNPEAQDGKTSQEFRKKSYVARVKPGTNPYVAIIREREEAEAEKLLNNIKLLDDFIVERTAYLEGKSFG